MLANIPVTNNRRQGLIGLIGFGSIVALISVVMFLGKADGCMNGSDNGSCPTLADVNGVRYQVSVAHALLNIEQHLTPYEPITRTNVPDYFSEMTTFRIDGLDPSLVLAAPAQHVLDEDVAPYRLLFGPDSDRAFPALCDFIPIERRLGDSRCGAPA